MLIRKIEIKDAEEFITLVKKVESESNYMLLESGERQTTPEQQRRQLEIIERQSNSVIFVTENEKGNLIGYLIAMGGSARKTRHSIYLVIGILEEYRGVGIGTRLFQELENWAVHSNIVRLELTVVTQNEAGVKLYKKSGFEVEGLKRKSLKIGKDYYDEYFMEKIL